jgi:transcriptional regulator GlxA family with amidase domain
MRIALVAYDGVSALEVACVHEVLARLPGARVTLVAARPGAVATGTLRLRAEALAASPRPDVLVVPGGRDGKGVLAADPPLGGWLAEAASAARWTIGVAEGVGLLAQAGALRGRRATTHWLARDGLAGLAPSDGPVVVDGGLVTASGASGACEAALHVVAEEGGDLLGRALQLAIEYDPDPPFRTGDPARASVEMRARAAALLDARPSAGATEVALVLYDGLTVLDLVGPYEVLRHVPGARVRLVALAAAPVTSDTGALVIHPTHTLAEVPAPDVVLVPGSNYSFAHYMREPALIDWLRAARRSARLVTSVCSGSLLLGAAGLLEGKRATSHWMPAPELARYGARHVAARWVDEGDVVTAAGVTAGIDMALALAARLSDRATAEAIELFLGYDPRPPYDCGSLRKAPPEVVREAARRLLFNRDLSRALRTLSPARVLPLAARLGWRLVTRPGSWRGDGV